MQGIVRDIQDALKRLEELEGKSNLSDFKRQKQEGVRLLLKGAISRLKKATLGNQEAHSLAAKMEEASASELRSLLEEFAGFVVDSPRGEAVHRPKLPSDISAEVHADIDARFPCFPVHHGPAGRGGQLLCDGVPVAGVARIDPDPGHAEIARQLEVGVAIADHNAGLSIDGVAGEKLVHEPGLRFAAAAAVARPVWADEDLEELDALRGEQLHDEVLYRAEICVGKARRTQSVLVADHHEFVAGRLKAVQGRHHAWHQRDFVEAVDLLILRFEDQRAVAGTASAS